MIKIRWSKVEHQLVLDETKKQFLKHPTMRTLDLVRMAQKVALPSERRRKITGQGQVEWVDKFRLDWDKEPVSERPIFVHELPEPVKPKPDIMAQLVELLSDAMVQVVAEAIVAARVKLDLPLIDIADTLPTKKPEPAKLKKIAVYGLFSNQVVDIRHRFKDCFEFRFLKDVSQDKLVSGAQWADVFFVMTKFVSHDYEAIKKYGNIRYVNGAASALADILETMYLESK